MTTLMRQEIDEIPDAVARLLDNANADFHEAGAHLKARDPAVIVTIARGSSDHAAHFLKYAIELQTGLPVASLGPSLASIYQTKLRLDRAAAFAVSQSGKSPDIVALAESARKGGALTFSLVNTLPSPLGDAANHAINIQAGPEKRWPQPNLSSTPSSPASQSLPNGRKTACSPKPSAPCRKISPGPSRSTGARSAKRSRVKNRSICWAAVPPSPLPRKPR